MNPYVKIITVLLTLIETFHNWIAQKHKLSEVSKVEKAVDTDNDSAIASELYKLADKVAKRKKTS